jgi:methyl-accepting chemotaxis protein
MPMETHHLGRFLASGQRRVFLVKRTLQFKIIMLVLGAVTIAVGLIGFDIYWTVGRDIVRDLMDPGLYGLFQHAAVVTAIKISFYLLGVAFVALLLSNKMAGPVYRFEKSARSVAQGDLTHRVRLRTGDELIDLQNEFNAMLESLHTKASQDVALAARISRQLDDLSKVQGLPSDVLQRISELKTEVAHVGNGFKLS